MIGKKKCWGVFFQINLSPAPKSRCLARSLDFCRASLISIFFCAYRKIFNYSKQLKTVLFPERGSFSFQNQKMLTPFNHNKVYVSYPPSVTIYSYSSWSIFSICVTKFDIDCSKKTPMLYYVVVFQMEDGYSSKRESAL